MKVKAFNIKHDVDYDEDLKDLPTEITFDINPADFEDNDAIEEWVSDAISDHTDFCHKGFEWTVVDDTP